MPWPHLRNTSQDATRDHRQEAQCAPCIATSDFANSSLGPLQIQLFGDIESREEQGVVFLQNPFSNRKLLCCSTGIDTNSDAVQDERKKSSSGSKASVSFTVISHSPGPPNSNCRPKRTPAFIAIFDQRRTSSTLKGFRYCCSIVSDNDSHPTRYVRP